MKITNWLDLLGGLALFFIWNAGFEDSLEDAAGDCLKNYFRKTNKYKI